MRIRITYDRSTDHLRPCGILRSMPLSRGGPAACPRLVEAEFRFRQPSTLFKVGTGGLSRDVLLQHVDSLAPSLENGPLLHRTRHQALVDTGRASVGCWLAYGALYGICLCVRPLVHFAVRVFVSSDVTNSFCDSTAVDACMQLDSDYSSSAAYLKQFLETPRSLRRVSLPLGRDLAFLIIIGTSSCS
ncbi:hypothetical protein BDZ89DRAFT_616535 [Hymenopellis radicata]|nr:hypothetical protein BDZ89DRAFT_616535 [Hymenopellis radicata]